MWIQLETEATLQQRIEVTVTVTMEAMQQKRTDKFCQKRTCLWPVQAETSGMLWVNAWWKAHGIESSTSAHFRWYTGMARGLRVRNENSILNAYCAVTVLSLYCLHDCTATDLLSCHHTVLYCTVMYCTVIVSETPHVNAWRVPQRHNDINY